MTTIGTPQVQQLMQDSPNGCEFDVHDAYGVGVRQTLSSLRRLQRLLNADGMRRLVYQFPDQYANPSALTLEANGVICTTEESPICVSYGIDDDVIRNAVACGRLLALCLLVEVYERKLRHPTLLDIEEVGMQAYSWLMSLAAQQLDEDSYEAWYQTWCQVPGKVPWALSEYGRESVHVRLQLQFTFSYSPMRVL